MPSRKRYKNRSRAPPYIFGVAAEGDACIKDENGTGEVIDGATDVAGPYDIFASVDWFVGRFCIVLRQQEDGYCAKAFSYLYV